MSEDKKYNGYTNYETWLCALWLDNDQGTQELMSEQAESLVDSMDDPNDSDEIENATTEMANFIESMVDEMTPELPCSMFSDMLNASLREIDYRDIAQTQLADALSEAQKERAA